MTAYNDAGFSVYLADGVTVPENTKFKQGVDVGNNVQDISFETDEEVDVIIRTNGGTLTVNAANATVKHYGEASNVTITAIAGNSYHEFGKVLGKLDVKTGHAVIESGASVAHVNTENGATVKVENKESVTVVTGAGEVTGADKTSDSEMKTVGTADDLVAAVANDTVKLIKLSADITLSSPLCITRDVIIDGNSQSLSVSGSIDRAINIGTDGSNVYDGITVTLQNITVNADNRERGINIAGANHTVNLFSVNVSCGYYAVNLIKVANSVKLTIAGSTLTGYAALNIWGYDNDIDITNSKLTANNIYNDAGNGFGAIVFEADTTSQTSDFGYNNSVTLSHCEVKVTATGTAQQFIVSFNDNTYGALDCTATFNACTLDYSGTYCDLVYLNTTQSKGNALIIDGKVEAQN